MLRLDVFGPWGGGEGTAIEAEWLRPLRTEINDAD